MTKSDLIDRMAFSLRQLSSQDIEEAVKAILENMAQALSEGQRIEIRGFGSFTLHYRKSRLGRNPKSGETVALPEKYVPRFKAGKELRERVNNIGR
ncbi:MAG: integration host factor subunit beta [Gammaproteobacteria bacterium]|nr:MAG: integration host factor subunit beta [Gammaproteobacteria bacterium]